MSLARTAALILLTLAVAPAASAQNKDPAIADLRREVADLRREISDLRREIYALRLDLLSAIAQSSGRPLPPSGKAPETPAPPGEDPGAKQHPPEEAATGKITGKVSATGDVGTAYVYVENVPLQLVKGQTIDIKQSGRQFQPRAAVVQVGTKVNFPNLDSVYHNVFSLTPNNTFDLGIYRAGDPTRSFTVTNPGVVDIYCNMHSEMSAAVLVVPSRLFAAVGKDGHFTLDNVPRGSRKVVAWGPGFEPLAQTVTVVGGKEAQLKFDLAPKNAQHTNKHGQPYGSYK